MCIICEGSEVTVDNHEILVGFVAGFLLSKVPRQALYIIFILNLVYLSVAIHVLDFLTCEHVGVYS